MKLSGLPVVGGGERRAPERSRPKLSTVSKLPRHKSAACPVISNAITPIIRTATCAHCPINLARAGHVHHKDVPAASALERGRSDLESSVAIDVSRHEGSALAIGRDGFALLTV